VEDAALKDFLAKQLAKGYIRVSKSPYTSPFFFIRKKDGKLHPVQDYRRINDITIRNQYPLPLISDLILDLSNAYLYTKLDIQWGITMYAFVKAMNTKLRSNTLRSLQTNGDVFWPYQLTGHLSDDDERHF